MFFLSMNPLIIVTVNHLYCKVSQKSDKYFTVNTQSPTRCLQIAPKPKLLSLSEMID